MTTIPKPGGPPAPAAQAPNARLSKEERRDLLARIERESSRAESPERVLQRAEQALQAGNRNQAERLVAQLEQKTPNLLGLDNLRARLAEAEKREKMRANVGKTEEMLVRYIELRKKPAAQFALEALADLAPDHPKLEEYGVWVRELEHEVAAQKELDDELAAGRAALQVGGLDAARRHLARLRRLDSGATATAKLAREISQAEAGEAESADIEEIKRRFEKHLAALRVPEAEKELALLASHAVAMPKITLDRFRVRLEEARGEKLAREELASFEKTFDEHLAAGRWQQARDVAQSAGRKFRSHPRPAEMFNEVNLREAEHRRQESNRQGLAALEQFIAQRKRDEALLALKLLQGKVEAAELAEYEKRVAAL